MNNGRSTPLIGQYVLSVLPIKGQWKSQKFFILQIQFGKDRGQRKMSYSVISLRSIHPRASNTFLGSGFTGIRIHAAKTWITPSATTSKASWYSTTSPTFKSNDRQPRKRWAFLIGATVAGAALTQVIFADNSNQGLPEKTKEAKYRFSVPWANKKRPDQPIKETDQRVLGTVVTPHPQSARRYFTDLSEAVDSHDRFDQTSYPVEKAVLTKAPEVPPPITRKHPVRLQVDMTSTVKVMNSSLDTKYEYWTFNDIVPGPFIRARVGDVLEVTFTNLDSNGLGHNIDFHAVTGPGGGAPATYAEEGQTRTAAFKLLYPGLWVYHCAAEPVPVHIANGMYGCILVEPEEGMAPADKEFYVMQSELYATPSDDNPRMLEFDYAAGLDEKPKFVVFNGRVGALTENPLKANAGDRVRVYFGNAGPNLTSAFHIIGTIFDRVHREGDLLGPPGRGIHTTTVGPGAASIIELDVPVPGNYALVDHAIFRLDKGCVGFLKVVGDDERKDIYDSRQPQINCAGCKLHS